MYTIRCEALKFKLRKSHKKVLKKVNKYLIEGIKPSSDMADGETEEIEKPTTAKPTKSKDQSAESSSTQSKGGQSAEEKVSQGPSKVVKSPRKGKGGFIFFYVLTLT